jgi:lauroyl/myristoyl acyltransferase
MQVMNRPVHLVMAHESNPTVEAFQRANLEAHGIRVIRSNASHFASVEMIRALGRGEIVAVQQDRAAPGQVTWPIEFFGRPAPFPPGPFVLARLSGAPLWPVFIVRLGRRRFRFLPERLRRIPRDATESDLEAVMKDVVGTFEARVREYPHQWFQFEPFWGT